jgi:long-chain fatty acid transport protein
MIGMKRQTQNLSALLSILLSSGGDAHAAGYALVEQSASGIGNAYAGAAASAEDASTIFFNPAGMTYLPDTQLAVAGHAIRSSIEFRDNGSHRSPQTGGLATQGGDGGDAGDWSFLPNVYFTQAVHPKIKLGIGVNAPFGLKTQYDSGWVGRYQALKSELKTVNLNPSVAYKVNDRLSLGLGFSALWAQAELTNAVDFGAFLKAPQRADGQAQLKGDNWSWGWNLGAMFQVTEATRVGMAYRSQVHQNLEGNVSFSGVPRPLAALFYNGPVTARLATPDSVSGSFFHMLNNQWDIMADLTWTHWSTFHDLTPMRISGVPLSSTAENWRDAFRASLGASFHCNENLKLRTGFAYDQSPVQGAYRTPRIPDSDRFWLSIGANYRLTPGSSLDFGYAHIFVTNSSVNKVTDVSAPALRDTVVGSYNSSIDILSVQFTHSF